MAPVVMTTLTSLADTIPTVTYNDEETKVEQSSDTTTHCEQPTEIKHNFYTQNIQIQPLTLDDKSDKLKAMKLDGIHVAECTAESEVKSDEAEFHKSPSTVFRFGTFDSQNFDMLVTPDEIVNDSFLLGLSDVNYDIEFSDLSAENSVAEDISPEKGAVKSPLQRDPFSPVGNEACVIAQTPLVPSNVPVVNQRQTEPHFVPSTSTASFSMPLSNGVNNIEGSFSLPLNNTCTVQEVSEKVEMSDSLLDNKVSDSPENLPSPIKPVTSEYSGFSTQGWHIPSIPCHTGDYSSLHLESTATSSATVQNGVAAATSKTSSSAKKDDAVVTVLGGIMDTFDKLF